MRDDETPLQPSMLRCKTCGHDLTGAVIGSQCPKCGQAIEDSLWPQDLDDGSDTARTGAAMAVASLLFVPFPAAGLLFGILACGLFVLAHCEATAARRPSHVRWYWLGVGALAIAANLFVLVMVMI